MKFITGLPDDRTALPRPCAATIGFFDGVHIGHRYLIRQVTEKAADRSLASLLVTFPIHPRRVMQNGWQPELLTSFSEKCQLLATTGADYCVTLPFTSAMASLSAHDFMQQVLHDHLQVRTLVIGHDHRFGHHRCEGFADYVRYGEKMDMEVVQAQALPTEESETTISSSVIRQLLGKGAVEEAARCLGYNYFMEGHITEGYRIGRTLGYPTANLHPDEPDKLSPADGVYAVRAHLGNEVYKAMLNIGRRPTIGQGEERTIEAHLLGFSGNLYHQSMRIEFVARLRDEQKFLSREALAAQLKADAAEAEKRLRF